MGKVGKPDLKLVLVGDSGVGKTCSSVRFFSNTFIDNCASTIGIDMKRKKININNKIIDVKIWDTAGQERFRTVTMSYLRCADLLLVCYDVTDLKSFRNLENWVKTIRLHSNDPKTPIIIVGTKIDAVNQRVVKYEDAERVSKENGACYYYEMSGKTGENVEKTFNDAIKIALKIPISTEIKDECDSNKQQNNKRCSVS
jgi:Ras-related protein Rab-1A